MFRFLPALEVGDPVAGTIQKRHSGQNFVAHLLQNLNFGLSLGS